MASLVSPKGGWLGSVLAQLVTTHKYTLLESNIASGQWCVWFCLCFKERKNTHLQSLKARPVFRERTLGSSPNVLCCKLKVGEASSQLSGTELVGLAISRPPAQPLRGR